MIRDGVGDDGDAVVRTPSTLRLTPRPADFPADEDYGWVDAYRGEYQTQFTTAAHGAGALGCELRDLKIAPCSTPSSGEKQRPWSDR